MVTSMANQVWKCDYCSETNASYDDIVSHENKCSFNPKNKYCWTCSNHLSDGFWIYGESYTCAINLNKDDGEEEGGCKGWTNEKT